MIKLSELKDDELLVNSWGYVVEAGEIKKNHMDYINAALHTTVPIEGKLNAEIAVRDHIDNQYENGKMHEEWDEQILEAFTGEDYNDIQKILNRVLERMGDANTSYDLGELVEIDL